MKHLIATISLLLLPMTASADGWYAGIAGGSTNVDTGITEVVGATLDETGTGTSVFIGKEVNETLTWERLALAETMETLSLFKVQLRNSLAQQLLPSPEKPWALQVRPALIWETTFEVTSREAFTLGMPRPKSTGTASASLKTDGTDIVWGVGAEYMMGEKTALLLGYDNYKLDDESVTFLHAGIRFKF